MITWGLSPRREGAENAEVVWPSGTVPYEGGAKTIFLPDDQPAEIDGLYELTSREVVHKGGDTWVGKTPTSWRVKASGETMTVSLVGSGKQSQVFIGKFDPTKGVFLYSQTYS